MKTFVIDAGHNPKGADTGAYGLNRADESIINLDMSEQLRNLFSKNKQVKTVYTRTYENPSIDSKRTIESLNKRISIANNTSNVDCFISLHCNAFRDKEVNGIEVFYYEGNQSTKYVADEICKDISNTFGISNRGAKVGNHLHLIKNAKTSTILIEMGFITNQHDLNQLTLNQNLYALTLYKTICRCYGVEDINTTWEEKAVQWAKENGISDGTRPMHEITRVETMQMFKNFHEKFIK